MNTFSDRFVSIRKRYPQFAEKLDQIRRVLESAPADMPHDPFVIAQQVDAPIVDVLGYLAILQQEAIGNLVVRVVDDRGLEVARYGNLREVPPAIENEFGDVTQVDPEHVDVVFVPSGAR